MLLICSLLILILLVLEIFFLFFFFIRLFEDAAQKLNMQALVSFLSELCTASHLQLIQMNSKSEEEEMLNIGSKLPTNAMLLYRLQEVLMKVLHTGRPLLHLVQAYNAVSTHLVEVSLSFFYFKLQILRHLVSW